MLLYGFCILNTTGTSYGITTGSTVELCGPHKYPCRSVVPLYTRPETTIEFPYKEHSLKLKLCKSKQKLDVGDQIALHLLSLQSIQTLGLNTYYYADVKATF